ncbi:MAG: hypothetical protein MI745_14815 [Pseudomonadales bacterium]|nr:hypothetical protein [Pseudomonadales bacterium]
MAVTLIDRKCYPELDLIMWDRADRLVSEKTAFHLYETRWRYVDQKRLGQDEKAMIRRLAQDYGDGVMLTA